MTTFLVTGGAGFIGSALVRQLIAETDARVVTVDSLTYAGNPESLGPALDDPRHHLIQADIRDAAAMRETFETHRPDAVLHLAAESHVDRSIDGPMAFVETNVVGTAVLLQAARAFWEASDRPETFRFLNVSTDEVYGSLGPDGAFHEASPYTPNSPYSASKAGADHLARAWHHTYGLPVIVTNCSNNYGPCQFPEKLVPLMILRALERQPLPVYGDGMQVRDWLHVDDHCRALRRVLETGKPGETYMIGGDGERPNIEIVRLICAAMDAARPEGAPHTDLIRHVADRPGHDRRYAVDFSRMRDELGWTPAVPLDDGLAQTVRWYLDNETWWRRILDGSYRMERLGVGVAE